tara:strand:+ start:244 stop:1056 length:813 start_codon:yes stop_codon:yes gene_type:complete
MDDIKDIPVLILCGGQGTRFREKTDLLPKPMIAIGERPILWHIMQIYSAAGFKTFVLALGYKGNVIKDYFLNYHAMNSDFTIDLQNPDSLHFHTKNTTQDWKITLVNTGQDSMTGARVARAARYLTKSDFMLTYGDGVANINPAEVLSFHRSHGKTGTVCGVHAPSRFGKLSINDKSSVEHFTEKPMESGISDYINGGFFAFKRDFLNYVSEEQSCILERQPLEDLSNNKELMAYQHSGFWKCMDTYRDWTILNDLWNSKNAPWAKEYHP